MIINNTMSEPTIKNLKIALVHDWIIGGGAEKVIYELHQMFPDAPIYTSYCSDEWRKKLDDKVVTGWLQHFPRLRKFMVIPRIWWFEKLNLSSFDVVISTSGNGEAFSVKTSPNTLHINYCHTPTHYYWRHYKQYLANPGFGIFNPVVRFFLRLLTSPLRKWDFRAAQRADVMVANSTHIQKDIKKYYKRDSIVIHPPVDTNRFKQTKYPKKDYYLSLGRQVPQKFVHIIVEACNELGLPLVVAGNGPENTKLMSIAGPTITFDNSKFSDEKVVEYMASAKAFIFPSLEDFGITPVEAMSAGTPVLAYRNGGAIDYVIPGKTGDFFTEQTTESLVASLRSFDPDSYKQSDLEKVSSEFSTQIFRKKILELLNTKTNLHV